MFMLEDLRHRAAIALARASEATVATYGPAGLQADLVPCAALGLRLYLLVPSTSEHLLNLETNPDVVVATATWRVHGRGHGLATAKRPPIAALANNSSAPWSVWVEVAPVRLTIAQQHGWGAAETIDIMRPGG
jgi:hypothetical protein